MSEVNPTKLRDESSELYLKCECVIDKCQEDNLKLILHNRMLDTGNVYVFPDILPGEKIIYGKQEEFSVNNKLYLSCYIKITTWNLYPKRIDSDEIIPADYCGEKFSYLNTHYKRVPVPKWCVHARDNSKIDTEKENVAKAEGLLRIIVNDIETKIDWEKYTVVTRDEIIEN